MGMTSLVITDGQRLRIWRTRSWDCSMYRRV
jgi:hypothetical protein